jgi:hypothetical protein
MGMSVDIFDAGRFILCYPQALLRQSSNNSLKNQMDQSCGNRQMVSRFILPQLRAWPKID